MIQWTVPSLSKVSSVNLHLCSISWSLKHIACYFKTYHFFIFVTVLLHFFVCITNCSVFLWSMHPLWISFSKSWSRCFQKLIHTNHYVLFIGRLPPFLKLVDYRVIYKINNCVSVGIFNISRILYYVNYIFSLFTFVLIISIYFGLPYAYF